MVKKIEGKAKSISTYKIRSSGRKKSLIED